MLKRVAVFAYAVGCYLAAMVSLAYAVGFIGNRLPQSLDSPARIPAVRAIFVDFLLMGIFALQHTIMARGWFKRRLPDPVGRSTYVLAASVLLFGFLWLWEPLVGVVWRLEWPAMRVALGVLRGFGWVLLALSTFLISHFDLFGIRQAWFYLRGLHYVPLRFRTPLFYRWVRHPLYLGWLLVVWAAPVMTASRLLFAVLTTAYLMVGIRFEERELIRIHGEAYLSYRSRVPMVLPFPARRRRSTSP